MCMLCRKQYTFKLCASSHLAALNLQAYQNLHNAFHMHHMQYMRYIIHTTYSSFLLLWKFLIMTINQVYTCFQQLPFTSIEMFYNLIKYSPTWSPAFPLRASQHFRCWMFQVRARRCSVGIMKLSSFNLLTGIHGYTSVLACSNWGHEPICSQHLLSQHMVLPIHILLSCRTPVLQD